MSTDLEQRNADLEIENAKQKELLLACMINARAVTLCYGRAMASLLDKRLKDALNEISTLNLWHGDLLALSLLIEHDYIGEEMPILKDGKGPGLGEWSDEFKPRERVILDRYDDVVAQAAGFPVTQRMRNSLCHNWESWTEAVSGLLKRADKALKKQEDLLPLKQALGAED